MSNYLLKETKAMNIKNISLDNGLLLNRNKIIVYDEEFILKIVTKKIQVKYQHLLILFNKLLEDNTDEGTEILLDEIAKFESILENKYQKLLKKDVYKNYINKILKLKDGISKMERKKGNRCKR